MIASERLIQRCGAGMLIGMRFLAALGAIALLSSVAPARAEQLRFHATNYQLRVTDGARTAILPTTPGVSSVEKVTLSADKARYTIAFKYDIGCQSEEIFEVTFEVRSLRARLANAEALQHHRALRYEEAARGYASALELDPSWVLARTNLACALSRLGKNAEALKTLAPLMRENPVRAYSKVFTDSDLEPLRTAPEILALRAKKQPALGAFEESIAPLPWVGLDGRAVAVFLTERSWGSYNYQTDLVIYEVPSRRQLVRTTLIAWNDTNPDEQGVDSSKRAVVAARLATTASWLRDLGFAPEPGVSLVKLEKFTLVNEEARPGRTPLPGSDLAIIVDLNETRVKRAGTNVGRAPIGSGFQSASAIYLPTARHVVMLHEYEDPEGCDNGAFVFAELIAVGP